MHAKLKKNEFCILSYLKTVQCIRSCNSYYNAR